MGKGGYLGGSTIVGGFGWSSFDPASPGKKGKKPKAAGNRHAASIKQGPKRVKRPPNQNALRLLYLDAIIDAALRSQPAPMPPRRAPELTAATKTAGGAIEWARAQKEFAVALERRQRKFAGKTHQQSHRKNVIHAAVPMLAKSAPSIKEAKTASIEALCQERARLNVALADAEKLVQKFRDSINQIDRQLAVLSPSRK